MRHWTAARSCLLLLLLLLGLSTGVGAEIIAQRTLSQSITTSGTDCTTATTCVIIPDIFRTVGVGVQLAGTWTGTAQFEGTLDSTNWNALSLTPLGTGAAVTSATANGVWTNANQVLVGIRVRASALASGTITVSIVAR